MTHEEFSKIVNEALDGDIINEWRVSVWEYDEYTDYSIIINEGAKVITFQLDLGDFHIFKDYISIYHLKIGNSHISGIKFNEITPDIIKDIVNKYYNPN